MNLEDVKAVAAGVVARGRAAVRAGLDIVAPPLALEGGRRAERLLSPGLSSARWAKVTFIEAPVCDGCGAPQAYDLGADARCPACLARRRAFDRVRAAALYDEASRDLILKLKRADRTDLAGLFATWLSRAARDLIEDADAVAPVPLHPLRLIQRRFNQAAEIARPLARRAGLAYLPDAVIRRRDTPSQGGRSASGRRRNVVAAFAAPRSQWKNIEGRRILLVDDVITTGATADACARVLKAAGAACVHVAAVARVQERDAGAI
ncbi:MAG TPA: ComF family protein [Caulobacteraceae bacterium]|nr:ComF family protein [Caulobacteraceae bacterium]